MKQLLDKGALTAEAWTEIQACRARLRFPRLLKAEAWLRRELGQGEKETPAASKPTDSLLDAFRLALGSSPTGAGCLPRALALRRYLARHGQPSRLGLGLKREEGRLRGHAWVEVAGEVVTDEAGFVRSFARLETARGGRSAAHREES